MPDVNVVTTALRDALTAGGLVRRPNDAGGLPPAFVEPAGGPPAPGDRESPETDGELVVTLRYSGEVSPGPGPGHRYRRDVIDVVYRSTTTAGLKAGRALDAAIRDLLTNVDTYGVGVQLPGLFVLEASVFGGLGPVSDLDGIRTEVAKYALETVV